MYCIDSLVKLDCHSQRHQADDRALNGQAGVDQINRGLHIGVATTKATDSVAQDAQSQKTAGGLGRKKERKYSTLLMMPLHVFKWKMQQSRW